MQTFYFTYGTADYFPYYGGWTKVIAPNRRVAEDLFRAVHPDRTPGLLLCANVYTEEEFMATEMYENNKNLGHGLWETIEVRIGEETQAAP